MWYIGHSVSGKKRAPGTCQDVLRVMTCDQQVVAVLSDGAGSAAHGGLGAKVVVQAAFSFLLGQKMPGLPLCEMADDLIAHVRQILMENARSVQVPIYALDATILVLVASPFGYQVLQVGDGFIVIQSQGEIERIGAPQKGEYANETVFITEDGAQPALYDSKVPVHYWAISSDGLEPVAIEASAGTPHAAFFRPFWEYLDTTPDIEEANQELHRFLTSSPLQSRIHDDVSLAIGHWHA